jgi:heme-degrading monooxygenase HmoA
MTLRLPLRPPYACEERNGMLARITTLLLLPGKLDEFIRIFQDSIAPATSAQPGFGGVMLMTDQQHSRVMAVGLWETEADLLAGEVGLDTARLDGVTGLLAGPPVREVYEVSVRVELTEAGEARIRGI